MLIGEAKRVYEIGELIPFRRPRPLPAADAQIVYWPMSEIPPGFIFARGTAALNPETGEMVAANIPRFLGGDKVNSYISEPDKTNYVQSATNYTLSPWVSNGIYSINYGEVDPWNGNNACKITETTGVNHQHDLYQHILNVPAGGTFAYTIFIKAGTCRYAVVTLSDATTGGLTVYFDMQEGVFSQALVFYGGWTNCSANFKEVQNGYYRIMLKGTLRADLDRVTPYVCPSDSPTGPEIPTYIGTGKYFFAAGSQVELDYVSTFIPTPAQGIGRRMAEVMTNTGAAGLVPDCSNFTIMFRVWCIDAIVDDAALLDSSNSNINRILVSRRALRLWDASGTLTGTVTTNPYIDDGLYHHIAFTVSPAAIKSYFEGIHQLTATPTGFPASFQNLLKLGCNYADLSQISTAFNSVRLFDRELTADEILYYAQHGL